MKRDGAPLPNLPEDAAKAQAMADDVEKALAMAEEYAAFAPGKLIPIDIHEKGDEVYEQLVVQALATVSFLFPQLGFDQRKALVALITASEELRNTWSSDNEKIHAMKLKEYKRTVEDSLTPFQIVLVEQRCKSKPGS
jgi:hypothetical protein